MKWLRRAKIGCAPGKSGSRLVFRSLWQKIKGRNVGDPIHLLLRALTVNARTDHPIPCTLPLLKTVTCMKTRVRRISLAPTVLTYGGSRRIEFLSGRFQGGLEAYDRLHAKFGEGWWRCGEASQTWTAAFTRTSLTSTRLRAQSPDPRPQTPPDPTSQTPDPRPQTKRKDKEKETQTLHPTPDHRPQTPDPHSLWLHIQDPRPPDPKPSQTPTRETRKRKEREKGKMEGKKGRRKGRMESGSRKAKRKKRKAKPHSRQNSSEGALGMWVYFGMCLLDSRCFGI